MRFCNSKYNTLIFLLLCSCSKLARESQSIAPKPQEIDPRFAPLIGGLISETPEQLEDFKNNFKQIGKVKLNPLGAMRLSQSRNLNLTSSALNQNIVAYGSETIAEGAPELNLNSNEAPISLPSYVDNSSLQSFPPVSLQGSASCVAWATSYYQAANNFAVVRNYAINGDLTKMLTPKLTYNLANGGELRGMSFYDAYNILNTVGAPSLEKLGMDSNYREWPLKAEVWRDASTKRAEKVEIIQNDGSMSFFSKVKTLLANGYLVTFGTNIAYWRFEKIKDDIAITEDDAFVGKKIVQFIAKNNSPHAMTLIGYNDDIWSDINGNNIVDPNEKGAFRVVNSWGEVWGDSGFIWLSYDAIGAVSKVVPAPDQPNRENAFYSELFHLPVKGVAPAKLIVEITASTANRKNAQLAFGISEPNENFILASSQYFPFYGYNGVPGVVGGAFAYDGKIDPVNATFVADLSEIAPPENTPKKLWLKIYPADTSITISSFVVQNSKGEKLTVEGLPLTVTSGEIKYLSIVLNAGASVAAAIPTKIVTQAPTVVPSKTITVVPSKTPIVVPSKTITVVPSKTPTVFPITSLVVKPTPVLEPLITAAPVQGVIPNITTIPSQPCEICKFYQGKFEEKKTFTFNYYADKAGKLELWLEYSPDNLFYIYLSKVINNMLDPVISAASNQNKQYISYNVEEKTDYVIVIYSFKGVGEYNFWIKDP